MSRQMDVDDGGEAPAIRCEYAGLSEIRELELEIERC